MHTLFVVHLRLRDRKLAQRKVQQNKVSPERTIVRSVRSQTRLKLTFSLLHTHKVVAHAKSDRAQASTTR